jgi:hypothetical protein
MALVGEQFLLSDPRVVVGDVLDVWPIPAGLRPFGRAPHPQAFALGGGGEPARQRGRVAEVVELVY